MDADTLQALQALQESIKHWEEVMANPLEEPVGVNNCPLCCRFYLPVSIMVEGKNCMGCPIQEKTGKQYCEDTPYIDFSALRKRYKKLELRHLAQSIQEKQIEAFNIYTSALREHARLELKFLKSLLPKEE